MQRISLSVPDDYAFIAGQYLNVKAPGNIDIPMSIASAPGRLPELELHYRSIPGLPEAAAMDQLLAGRELLITDAAGDVTVSVTETPVLMVVGGSGAAQAFSYAEDCRLRRASNPIQILWCADTENDVYATDALLGYPNLLLEVCIDSRRTSENKGLSWLRANSSTYLNAQVVLAGSPGFVYAATDILLASGFSQTALHSDIYSYAPRS